MLISIDTLTTNREGEDMARLDKELFELFENVMGVDLLKEVQNEINLEEEGQHMATRTIATVDENGVTLFTDTPEEFMSLLKVINTGGN